MIHHGHYMIFTNQYDLTIKIDVNIQVPIKVV